MLKIFFSSLLAGLVENKTLQFTRYYDNGFNFSHTDEYTFNAKANTKAGISLQLILKFSHDPGALKKQWNLKIKTMYYVL